jgi:hypothetical protein
MHASIPERKLWVFTYRKPGDFFSSIDLSVVPADASIERTLSTLHRHDHVEIRGTVIRRTPQVHVRAQSVRVLESFERDESIPPYAYKPSDLPPSGTTIARVHAVGADPEPGLVVEIRDAVVPVRVADSRSLAGLYRGDIIRFSYEIAEHPSVPTHLVLNTNIDAPLEVLDAIARDHGEPIEREGILVRFPQSPQIAFDVYALQSIDAHGIAREYTLVNFDDQDVFAAIRKKLGDAWVQHASTARDGRNKQVKGIKNVVARDQANPQILLASPADIEIIVDESSTQASG